MSLATDAGVRSGKNSTEMWMFLASGAMILINGTPWVDVPWDTVSLFLGISGLGIGARAAQKTVATYVSGRLPDGGNQRVPAQE